VIKLHVIQAEYGDCFILDSKLGKDSMNVLIDGGPYVAELLYEIVVENRPKPESKGSVGFQPPRNLAIIKRIVGKRRRVKLRKMKGIKF
jgi:hypothetical protein